MRDPFAYGQIYVPKPSSDGGYQSGQYILLVPMTAPQAHMLGYETIYTQPPSG